MRQSPLASPLRFLDDSLPPVSPESGYTHTTIHRDQHPWIHGYPAGQIFIPLVRCQDGDEKKK